MNKNINPILEDFKKRVRKLYGNKLKNILLYGSWARGDVKEHSDIDLAVLLEGEVNLESTYLPYFVIAPRLTKKEKVRRLKRCGYPIRNRCLMPGSIERIVF
jgi:predicted nucleotidyltransferase